MIIGRITITDYFSVPGAESSAWVDSFNFFTDRKRAHFERSFMELLGSYMFPYADFEEFRTCCDLMNVLTAHNACIAFPREDEIPQPFRDLEPCGMFIF